MDEIDLDDLHSTRIVLEVAGGRLAAVNHTQEDIDHLERIIEKMRDRTLTVTQRVMQDAEFHIALARSGRNELLARFVEVMTTLLHDYMAVGVLMSGGIDDALARHTKIIHSLAARDPDITETAIREHLSRSRANVQEFKESGKDIGAFGGSTVLW